MNIVYLLVYLAVSSFGLYRLKASHEVISWGFFLGFCFYGAGFLMWIFLLRRMPLSLIFPIASGGLIVATQVSGWLFLNENVSLYQCIGCLLIVAGSALVYLQS